MNFTPNHTPPHKVLNFDQLSDADKELLLLLESLSHNAYAPYSGFKVSAIARTADGVLHKGVNMENAAYPVCICAEGACLTAYNTSGSSSPIVKMAIYAKHSERPSNGFAAPCGACRQMILEMENRQDQDIEILLKDAQDQVMVIPSIKMLLPLGFSKADLLNP